MFGFGDAPTEVSQQFHKAGLLFDLYVVVGGPVVVLYHLVSIAQLVEHSNRKYSVLQEFLKLEAAVCTMNLEPPAGFEPAWIVRSQWVCEAITLVRSVTGAREARGEQCRSPLRTLLS